MPLPMHTMLASSLALLLTACAGVPLDEGVDGVESLVTARLERELPLPHEQRPAILSESEATRLLAFPLSIRDSERIALYRNPRVGANLAEVGLAQADLAQAGRLRNPGFSLSRFSGNDYEATTLFDIGGLVLMPLRKRMASRRFEIAQYQAAEDIIDHLGRTREAWIEAVAQAHKTRLMVDAVNAVQVGNDLTRQMTAIGHGSLRESVRSELDLAEFRAALSRQRVRENSAREALIRQLGVWGSDAALLTLPSTLESPPEEPVEYAQVAARAVADRLDVEMARRNLETMADNFKLTRRSPFVNAIELGPVFERSAGGRETGFEIELVLPIFDAGGISSERARIAWRRANAQAESTAISAASEAREALQAYRRAFDIARVYEDRVLPLRERLSREEMLRYNGMLISVFDLLDDAGRALQTRMDHVDALRDFWLADSRMKLVLVASGNNSLEFSAAATIPESPAGAAGH